MRILKILFFSDDHGLRKKIINYLLDCGHRVDQVCSDRDFKKQTNDPSHSLVKIQQVDCSDYDLFICFKKNITEFRIPTIEICTQISQDVVSFIFTLTKQGKLYNLYEGICNFDLADALQNSLEIIISSISDSFIDALLAFQQENYNVFQSEHTLKLGSFYELMKLERQLARLLDYNQELREKGTIFSFPALVNPVSYNCWQTNAYKFTQFDIELLALYLQCLFNGRRNAVYHYEISLYGKAITKQSFIDTEFNFDKLFELINAKHYDIIKNDFYKRQNTSLFAPQIFISNDLLDSCDNTYQLKVLFDLPKQKLIFKYLDNHVYFDTLEKLVNDFFYRLPFFIVNKNSFDYLLYCDDLTYNRSISTWNQTEEDFPCQKTIHQIFEEQVAQFPQKIALVYNNIKLTYEELNKKANQLAHYLRNQYTIQGDELIPLYLDRSEKVLIAILGVLKAGAAYVPLDPAAPSERLQYQLSDINAKLIITEEKLKGKVQEIFIASPLSKQSIFSINAEESKNQLEKLPISNLPSNITSAHLAYVIYTSGSTGFPKGVMVEHHSVINLVSCFTKQAYKITPAAYKIAAFSPCFFDVSVIEYFTSLLNVGELHLLPEETRTEIGKLSDYLLKENIHYAYFPASMLRVLPKANYCDLQGILTGVEKLEKASAQYWAKNYPIYNYYGLTEATVCSVGNRVYSNNLNSIGKPLFNTRLYIMDACQRALPVGAIGELYIAGEGLARGYLNQPELTQESFISNPFQTEDDKAKNIYERLYKTGDLVRYLPDGNIEYIGRKDNQVKMNGYRIELGEIESRLLQYEGVSEAAVMICDEIENSGQVERKILVGYYASVQVIDEQQLLQFLSEFLPHYMLPSVFVAVEKFPLTANGKLDRKGLPKPEIISTNYVAPETELEKQLSDIYAEVLELPVKEIGVHNDFFALGGDSILSIQLVNQIRSCWNIEISVKNILECSSISTLSILVASLKAKSSVQREAYTPFILSHLVERNT